MEKKKKLYDSLNKCNSSIEEKKKILKMIEDDAKTIENMTKYFPNENINQDDQANTIIKLKKIPSAR